MSSPTEIKLSQLNRLIGTPNCPIIIDLRIDEDFDLDPRYIPTSFRYDFHKIAELAPELAHKQVVVYCHKGLKISQGATAILRNHGVCTECLEGGFVAWEAASYLLVDRSKIEPYERKNDSSIKKSSLWVTKRRPKIDRIACPWLIRRFIDPRANFLFVSPDQVNNVAEKFNAIAFDMDDSFWGHRGDQCSFDAFIAEFDLKADQALLDLAKIVRAADTDRLDTAPEAAGLLAASLGLSRIYRDDLEQLDAGMQLYDAFYRWARDAKNETHQHSQ